MKNLWIATFMILFTATLPLQRPIYQAEAAQAEWDISQMSREEKIALFTELINSNCECKGVKLYGKVQFVESFPDLKIQYVTSFPDIKVQYVTSFPDKCGKWQKVTSFPDFKVQLVSSFPDLKVQVVESFPGMR
jgi:hypothetical protein